MSNDTLTASSSPFAPERTSTLLATGFRLGVRLYQITLGEDSPHLDDEGHFRLHMYVDYKGRKFDFCVDLQYQTKQYWRCWKRRGFLYHPWCSESKCGNFHLSVRASIRGSCIGGLYCFPPARWGCDSRVATAIARQWSPACSILEVLQM